MSLRNKISNWGTEPVRFEIPGARTKLGTFFQKFLKRSFSWKIIGLLNKILDLTRSEVGVFLPQKEVAMRTNTETVLDVDETNITVTRTGSSEPRVLPKKYIDIIFASEEKERDGISKGSRVNVEESSDWFHYPRLYPA